MVNTSVYFSLCLLDGKPVPRINAPAVLLSLINISEEEGEKRESLLRLPDRLNQ